jgi:hypothetical protein
MNSITLLGVLTKDPKPVGGEGRRGCRMRLAEANAHPDHPLYVDASIFGPQAETCLEHLRKGSRVDLSRRSEHWIATERVDFLSSSAPGRSEGAVPSAEEA